MPTKIEWCDEVWNPVTGCTPISEGCKKCYALRMSKRLAGRFGYPAAEPFNVTLHPERLEEPLKWKKPRRVFVCSMSDLFHEDVPFEYITQIFDVMCSWKWPNKEAKRLGDESFLIDPGHTFMVLTKRPHRVLDWLWWLGEYWPGDSPVNINLSAKGHFGKHIWFGVTAENQKRADERIPILLQIPAAVRFVSIEPMLGPVDLTSIRFDRNTIMNVLEGCGTNRLSPCQSILNAFCNRINWTIVGGETGPGARPMHPDWVRSLVLQCINAGVPFFFKSWGEWMPSYQTGTTFELSRLKTDEVVMSGPGHGVVMKKVGKKAAGHLIDGQEWRQFPEGAVQCR